MGSSTGTSSSSPKAKVPPPSLKASPEAAGKAYKFGPPPSGPAPAPPPGLPHKTVDARSRREWNNSAKNFVGNLEDNGTLSGGTGGTVDLGHGGEKVIEMIGQQAQKGQQVGAEMPIKRADEDEFDFDLGLEDMVEELAGVNSYPDPPTQEPPAPPGLSSPPTATTSQELLEEAWLKMEGARDALSKVIESNADSDLRVSAPAFVPGEIWTGSQISSFVD
jgi:hypothetical protein